jgi:uncharacterized protein (DUF2252 family)
LIELFSDPDVKRSILSLDGKDRGGELRLVDATYWMKGCSSLALLRYAGIIAIRGAKGRENFVLVDLKEATKTRRAGRPRSRDAKRSGRSRIGRRASAVASSRRTLDCNRAPRQVGHYSGTRPQNMKLEVEQFSESQAVKAARYLAFIIGKAHARQMDREQRTSWRRTLRYHRGSGIDTPTWLWQAVVDLSGSHAAGYLEHCRRYALRPL